MSNNLSPITVSATLAVPLLKAWLYYTLPEHIVNLNFASPDWCCPSAQNDLCIGGTYKARMEARDGSIGFDFEAIYTLVYEGKMLKYIFGDRHASVTFRRLDEHHTAVEIVFDPETMHPVEMQRDGWQPILNNYNHYTETH